MEKVIIGKLITTHGIKGEVRITSDFEYKDKVFKIGNILIIKGIEYTINSYRVHKGYDMVTFVGVNDINEVIPLKQQLVYFKREELHLDENEYLFEDLINMDVILEDNIISKVHNYNKGMNKLIIFKVNNKDIYIPLAPRYIKSISVKDNKIVLNKEVSELM